MTYNKPTLKIAKDISIYACKQGACNGPNSVINFKPEKTKIKKVA